MATTTTLYEFAFGDELRRWVPSSKVTFQILNEQAARVFGFPSAPAGMVLKYEDCDGDLVTIGGESDMEEFHAQKLPVARVVVMAPSGEPLTGPGQADSAPDASLAKSPMAVDEDMETVAAEPKHPIKKANKAQWEPARMDKFLNNLSKHLTMVAEGQDVAAKVVQILSRGCKHADAQGMQEVTHCLQQSCSAHPAVLRLLFTLSTTPEELKGIKRVPLCVRKLAHQATKTFLDGLPPLSSPQTTPSSVPTPTAAAAAVPWQAAGQSWAAERLPKLLNNLSQSLAAMEEDSSAVAKVLRMLSKATQKARGDGPSLKQVMACLHGAAQATPSIREGLSRLLHSAGPSTGETVKVPSDVHTLIRQAMVDPGTLPAALAVVKPPKGQKGAKNKWHLPRVTKFLANLQVHLHSMPDSACKVAVMLTRASKHASNEDSVKIVSLLRDCAAQDPGMKHHLEMLASSPEVLCLRGRGVSVQARAMVEQALVVASEDAATGQEEGGDICMAPGEPDGGSGGEQQLYWRPKRVEKFSTNLARHLASMGCDPEDAKKTVFMLTKASCNMDDGGKSNVIGILRESADLNANVLELLDLLSHRPGELPLKRKIPEGVRALAMHALGVELPLVDCDVAVISPEGDTQTTRRAARRAKAGKPVVGWSPKQVTRFMGKISALLSSMDHNSGKGAWKMAHMMDRACSNTAPGGKLELVAILRDHAEAIPAVKQHLQQLVHGPHSFGRKRPVPEVVQMLALWALDTPASGATTDEVL